MSFHEYLWYYGKCKQKLSVQFNYVCLFVIFFLDVRGYLFKNF